MFRSAAGASSRPGVFAFVGESSGPVTGEGQCFQLNGTRYVPWEQHRCFFEEWSAQEEARHRVRATARNLGNHPGTSAIIVANEFVGELLDIVKQEAPQCPISFASHPPTEFLEPRGRDFVCCNVYVAKSSSPMPTIGTPVGSGCRVFPR